MIRSSTLLFLILGAAGAAGCVANEADAPMRIMRNIAPGEGCVIDPTTSGFYDDGIIDAQSRIGYVFTPEVRNDLTLIDGESSVPKIIFIEGANVDITFYDTELFPRSDYSPELLSFLTPTSGSIEPAGGTAGFSFEILSAALLQEMAPTLEAQPPGFVTTLDVAVQMVGTKGGGGVESNVFRYPVQVCLGCMVELLGACDTLETSFVGSDGGECNPLQDQILQCCDGPSGQVCPARAPGGA